MKFIALRKGECYEQYEVIDITSYGVFCVYIKGKNVPIYRFREDFVRYTEENLLKIL